MDEELEQSDENQNQVNEELEQSESSRDQLIEIYKIQSQLANSISNRRITIHKFYLLLMSGLVLIFPAYFKLPDGIQHLLSIEHLIIGAALLGITLSLAWFILVNSNLRQNIIKYEVLKKLENKLEYQFFQDEWKFLEKYRRSRTYWETSYIEIFIPILFFFIFTLLLHLASANFPDKPYSKLHYYPGILTGAFCLYWFRWWQIDREIRGIKKWRDSTTDLVALVFPILIVLAIYFLFQYMGCGIIKEPKSVDEKPTETSAEMTPEETTKGQIILPDEEKVKSVDEEPAEVNSDGASPDGEE